jgi:phosphoribosyl 1,2-cyclic phosphodiesterase
MLGSGSRGNAMLVECDGSRVLVDVGFGPRALAQRLHEVNIAPESIEAAVITHEHTDHVGGLAACARRWGWALFATRGTIAGSRALASAGATALEAGLSVDVSTLSLLPVRTSHDAQEPIALVATGRRSGERLGVAYDLGCVTKSVRAAFHDLDLLVVEANHDDGMLRNGPYPRVVQDRIAGRTGHLSNRDGAEFARGCVRRELRHVILAHLSEQCNTPSLALGCVGDSLRSAGYRGRVHAAHQQRVVGPFEASGHVTSGQLSLWA